MTIPVSQITNNQTFGAWLSTTNRLAELVSQNVVTSDATTGGSVTTGNVFVNGHLGSTYMFVANTLSGGNVSSGGQLNILANVAITNGTSNVVSITANSTAAAVAITSNTASFTVNSMSVSGNSATLTISGTLNANVATLNVSSTILSANANTVTVTGNTGTIRLGNSTVNTTITESGITFSGVNVNTAISGNAATAYANAVANAAAVYQTMAGLSANVAKLTANNSNNLGGVSSANYVNTSGAYTLSGVHTHTANIVMGNSTVNTVFSNGSISINNGNSVVNATTVFIGNTTVNTVVSAASITLNGVNVNTAITGNAASAYANAVANAAALYQTTAGMSANVAALTANAANFLGNSSGTVANIASWVTGNASSAYTNATTFASNGSNISTGTVAAARLPTGNTTQVGVVQLADSVSNSSSTVAATANSVKTVYDYAASIAATGTPPSGANTNIQYNNSGVFGGSSGFTFNSTTNVVSIGVGGSLSLGNATVNTVVSAAAITLNGVNVNTAITGNAATAYANAVANAAAIYQTMAGLAANVFTLSANNAAYLAAVPATSYVTITDAYTINGVHTHTANIVMGNSTVNTVFSNGSILINNGNLVANATTLSIGNATVNATLTSTGLVTAGSNTLTIGTALYSLANGFVGIGTSSPAYKLDVSGTSATGSGLRVIDTDGGQAQIVVAEGANSGQIAENNGTLYLTNYANGGIIISQINPFPITMYTNNLVRMIVSGNGNIGVGNSSPVHLLSVNGDGYFQSSVTLASGATSTGNVAVGNSTVNTQISNGAITISGSNTITIGTAIYGVANGNVGLGNTTPAHRLSVDGAVSITAGINANGSLGTSGQALFSNGAGLYWANVVAGATLTANNTDTQTFYLPMSNTTSGAWSNGVVSTTKLYFVPSSGTLNATIFNSLSDRTKKTDIVDVDDGLGKVLSMRGVEFNWEDTGSRSAGVVAQELEMVAPHLVSTDSNGVKSVNYGGIVAYLISAIHDLNEKIESLK